MGKRSLLACAAAAHHLRRRHETAHRGPRALVVVPTSRAVSTGHR
ncbi:hypothetical protein ABLN97_08740 [Mycobacterium tuberculosis]